MEKLKRLRHFLADANHLSGTNAVLLLLAVAANCYWQVFCIPTDWAIGVLVVCFGTTIFYPLLNDYRPVLPFISFLNGVAFCVFLYGVLFLDFVSLLAIPLLVIGAGVLCYIPHFLAFQLFWKYLVKPAPPAAWIPFVLGVAGCFSIVVIAGNMYRQALQDVRQMTESNYTTLNRTFMTEKILGMNFIYHISVNPFEDGWRPPRHEPMLILGMWLHGRKDPLHMPLSRRIALYKKFFPENQIKFSCSCAIKDSHYYHQDERLR